ncbi:MAG TPA: DUF481 domain-containing protein [Acidobacteriaceae bacterium]|nr:DUF481 domain-containing protein [Acidobacteriaceae bacterium]
MRCTLFPRCYAFALSLLLAAVPLTLCAQGADKSKEPDTLVLSNGDTLHGTLVQETNGTVTFHSDALGDIKLDWEKIQSLHTSQAFAVLGKQMKKRDKHAAEAFPRGTVEVANGLVTLHPENGATIAPIPVKSAQVIVSAPELDKELRHEPGFLEGWNGAATAGATLVTATQNSYAVSGSVGLVRTVPTVTWLDPRNRTSADFSASFGKITQPSYTSGGVFTPATTTKSSILHFDAERDQYFSPRMFALAQTAFDHNFSQDLDLQQIYGGGLGWTFLKTPIQEADLKATMQYEKQQFIAGSTEANQNLIGSTFSVNYLLKLKLVTYAQELSFIPAYNNPRAYSATETNTLTFPTYKNFGFSVGTLDSYLNDPPLTAPPTRRNSFQFTMGVTYAFKSKY